MRFKAIKAVVIKQNDLKINNSTAKMLYKPIYIINALNR